VLLVPRVQVSLRNSLIFALRLSLQWLEEVNDHKAAAEMYWTAKEYDTAIRLYGDNGWHDALMEKVRSLHKLQHRKELETAVIYFRNAGLHSYAQEIYMKIDDIKSLMALHVALHKWDDAFLLARSRPEFAADIYFPYAEWLAENDRFDEAQDAFEKAGRPVRTAEHCSCDSILCCAHLC
jgi:intraflagellar transport protein 122